MAEALTRTPQAVDDAIFDQAARHFSPDAMVELVTIASWENAVARFNHAFGIASLHRWNPSPK